MACSYVLFLKRVVAEMGCGRCSQGEDGELPLEGLEGEMKAKDFGDISPFFFGGNSQEKKQPWGHGGFEF